MEKDNLISKFGTTTFWSWNGDIDKNEVVLQLKDMAMKGINGVFIHARAGLKTEYMGKDWFDNIEAVLQEAKNLGVDVWLYDENGWPSGSANGIVPNINRHFCQTKLKFRWMCDGPNPDNTIVCFEKAGEEYVKTKRDDINRLVFYYEINCNYTDLLNKDAVSAFIENTHMVYKAYLGNEFGKTIKGIFTDEPQLIFGDYPWSTVLESEFINEYGYGLSDNLYKLTQDVEGCKAFRYNFWKLVTRLFVNSYTKQLYDFCSKNNLLLVGHASSEDSLVYQMTSCGAIMPNYEYFHIPGIDHLGNRLTSPVLSKQVSSAARQFGKKYILSETFGCSGWEAQFKDYLWIWAWQGLNGINIPCLHLSAYTIKGCRKRDYPQFFSYQEPWWEHFDLLCSELKRISKFVTDGEIECDTLLLHPISSIWAEGTPYGNEIIGEISTAFRNLSDNLMRLGVNYDYGDELLMEKYAIVEDGTIIINNCVYKNVIIPPSTNLSSNTVSLLKQFISGGGKILLVDKIPSMVNGVYDNDVVNFFRNSSNIKITFNRMEYLAKEDFICTKYGIKLYETDFRKLCTDIYSRITIEENGYKILLFNPSRTNNKIVVIRIPGKHYIDSNESSNILLTNIFRNSWNTDFTVEVEANSFCLIHITDTEEKEVCVHPIKTDYLNEFEITVEKENILTIDNARYKINGKDFSDRIDAFLINNHIFNIAAKLEKTSDLVVSYEFITYDDLNMFLAVESEDAGIVMCNGYRIEKSGCFIDKCLHSYKIDAALLNKGINNIDVHYDIEPYKEKFITEEDFEIERNKFSFPKEIESIYLYGNFEVKINPADITDFGSYYAIKNQTFELTSSLEHNAVNEPIMEFTKFFARGNICYSKEIIIQKTYKKVLLNIHKFTGSFAEIIINNNSIKLSYSNIADITKYLKLGKNKINIIIHATNRNIFGPHHHKRGKLDFVGPSSFRGIKGWEDFISPCIDENTHTSDYNIVKFGLYDLVSLEYYDDNQ